MSVHKIERKALLDSEINIKWKLAMIWASLMFLYIYVDYFHLFMPGKLEDIRAGRVYIFDITPGFLVAALAAMSVPALMIFLSAVLPAIVNRWANILIAAIYIPFTLFNLAGEAWLHMIFGAVLEVILLCFVITYAWKWPRVNV
jgi:hypothetical protein